MKHERNSCRFLLRKRYRVLVSMALGPPDRLFLLLLDVSSASRYEANGKCFVVRWGIGVPGSLHPHIYRDLHNAGPVGFDPAAQNFRDLGEWIDSMPFSTHSTRKN